MKELGTNFLPRPFASIARMHSNGMQQGACRRDGGGKSHLYSGLSGSACESISCVTDFFGNFETPPGKIEARNSRDKSSFARLISSLSAISVCGSDVGAIFRSRSSFCQKALAVGGEVFFPDWLLNLKFKLKYDKRFTHMYFSTIFSF